MHHQKQWNSLFAIEQSTDYEAHLHATVRLVRKEAERLDIAGNSSLSFLGLVAKQFQFFAWKIWLFQGMVLAVLCSIFFSAYTFRFHQWSAATLPKFLCLCSAVVVMSSFPILKRSSRYKMLELEQSTHFSIKSSLLSQLLFIGIGDLFMLTILTMIVAKCELTISVTFISLVIPFMTAMSSCLMLWVRTTFSCFQTMSILLCFLSSWFGYLIVDVSVTLHWTAQLCLWTGCLLFCTGILYRAYRRLSYRNTIENMLP